jgi:lipopolysaccharide transport protein LptA
MSTRVKGASFLVAMACVTGAVEAPGPQEPMLRPSVTDVEISLGGSDGLVAQAEEAVLAADGRLQSRATHLGSEQGPGLDVSADVATWDFKTKKVLFVGNVVAIRRDLVLSCERLEVAWKGGSRVESAQATGGVRIERGGLRASGERAHLDVNSGRLELGGSPELSQGAQALKGRVIVLFLDDERVECQGCALHVQEEAVLPLPQVGPGRE